MPKTHNLGFGCGRIVEYEDGSAGFIPLTKFTQAFRVQIADVTGFSVTRGNKALERTLNILGNGTVLASASVNHGASEKIEAWFRAHPRFRSTSVSGDPGGASTGKTVGTALIADELRKLAELHEEGILTDGEFAEQKSRLLDR
jgi:hypothetical protein